MIEEISNKHMENKFENCIMNIMRNMEDYINGKLYAIDDLATKLRVMCHDTNTSKSLLSLMEWSGTNCSMNDFVKFVNTNNKKGVQFGNELCYKILGGMAIFHQQKQQCKIGSFKCRDGGRIEYNLTNNSLYFGNLTFEGEESLTLPENYCPKETDHCYRWLLRGRFNDEKHEMLFKNWWEEEVIFIDNKGFKRKDIVLFIANKSGGAHVDPNYCQEDLYKLEKEKIDQLINLRPVTSGLHDTLIVIAQELIRSFVDKKIVIFVNGISIPK